MATKLYTKPSCASSRKARAYLASYGINYEHQRLNQEGITEEDLRGILSLTENGVEDILKRNLVDKFQEVKMNDFIQTALANPTILKTPILFDKNKLVVGYNEEEIRLFMPRNEKRKEMKKLLLAI